MQGLSTAKVAALTKLLKSFEGEEQSAAVARVVKGTADGVGPRPADRLEAHHKDVGRDRHKRCTQRRRAQALSVVHEPPVIGAGTAQVVIVYLATSVPRRPMEQCTDRRDDRAVGQPPVAAYAAPSSASAPTTAARRRSRRSLAQRNPRTKQHHNPRAHFRCLYTACA